MVRDFYYDNIKGFLIIGVVLLHTLSNCASYYGFDYSFYKVVALFLMPLFLFTTGKFARLSRRTPAKRAFKMLYLFVISQVLITGYFGYILHTINPIKQIWYPRYTLWYLLTCVYLYLSEYILRKVPFKYAFPVSVICALGSGFVPQITNFLSISRTINNFPFFILGYYSDEIHLVEKIKKWKKPIIVLTTIVVIWLLLQPNYLLYKDIFLKLDYYTYQTPMMCFLKRILVFLISSLLSSFIFVIFTNKKTPLVKLGQNTLMIYLFHGVLIKTILYYKWLPGNAVLGVIISFITIFLTSLLFSYTVSFVKKKMATLKPKNA